MRESAVGDSRAPATWTPRATGRTRPCTRTSSGPTCANFQKVLDDHGDRCVYYGDDFGQGLRPHADGFRPQERAPGSGCSARSWRSAPTWWCPTRSLAGEYAQGDGRAELAEMFGPELTAAFDEFKRIWVPTSNEPEPADRRRQARRGPAPRPGPSPPELTHRLRLPRRRGLASPPRSSAASAWPSAELGQPDHVPELHVTREERHSTRGRAPLLFEMLKGDPVSDRLARRRGQGVARPAPGLQGRHGRLPGSGRHPDLQGRVPLALRRGRRRPLNQYVLGLLPWWDRSRRAPHVSRRALRDQRDRRAAKRRGLAEERDLPRSPTRPCAPGTGAASRGTWTPSGDRSSCGGTPSPACSSRASAGSARSARRGGVRRPVMRRQSWSVAVPIRLIY